MGIFSGRADTDHDDPLDDTADFVLTARQEHLRNLTETRRQMERVAASIWGPNGTLTAYARTLKWVDARGRRRSP